MQVKFLLAYDGYSVGDVAELVPFRTEDLISRKIVKPYVDESKKDAKIEKLTKEVAKLKRQIAKKIDAAPENKQFVGAANK